MKRWKGGILHRTANGASYSSGGSHHDIRLNRDDGRAERSQKLNAHRQSASTSELVDRNNIYLHKRTHDPISYSRCDYVDQKYGLLCQLLRKPTIAYAIRAQTV